MTLLNHNKNTQSPFEVNFDGLVGPSHNYAGLSYGNKASAGNRGLAANPREGALEGLAKMRHLVAMGMTQGILPPHDRPALARLKALGFTGSDHKILAAAYESSPLLMANLTSASAMWTANAATVSPKWDTRDGRTHFTPANLAAMYHRSIEWTTTGKILARIFPEGEHFGHHPALEGGIHFGDEGAANHNRFCHSYDQKGVALFVYGKPSFEAVDALKFPGRQTKEASEAIARLHGLTPEQVVLWPQNPAAINAGAFHNDVVAVANKTCFFYHEYAFQHPNDLEKAITLAAKGLFEPVFIRVPAVDVSLEDAVKSYIFNSQLISVPGRDKMTLILPADSRELSSTKAYIDSLIASGGPIGHAEYLDVRQSMRNGGGPACLRLRVVLDDKDRANMAGNVILDENKITALEAWVHQHYRDNLVPDDLRDPLLWQECMTALDALSGLLDLGAIYDFQR